MANSITSARTESVVIGLEEGRGTSLPLRLYKPITKPTSREKNEVTADTITLMYINMATSLCSAFSCVDLSQRKEAAEGAEMEAERGLRRSGCPPAEWGGSRAGFPFGKDPAGQGQDAKEEVLNKIS